MKQIFKLSSLAFATTLAACGGGGGSPGETQETYSITLRADKNQLPLNINNTSPGIGVYSPYTTTLYVQASLGGRPIPGGEDEIFGCNVAGGLNSGSLYYLDGKEEHEVEVDDGNGGKIKVPGSYRSITLGANSGGNSFHFSSGDQAGTAKITCSVTDPRDKQQKSASVDITVGGATGKAASIQGIAAYPLLGTQGNKNNLRTSTAIEAQVFDDANQNVPVGVNANLQVAIASGASGARLLAGGQSGSVVRLQTTGGVGLFTLSSGAEEGPILLEMKSDRFDNDVTNGIQDEITALLVVHATVGNQAGVPLDPLTLVEFSPPTATTGLPYSYVFSAEGGAAPYTWTALGSLPGGLSLASSGLLSGTPYSTVTGQVPVAVRVTDSQGASKTGNFSLQITAAPVVPPVTPEVPAPSPLSINISGCGSDVNTACALPDAPVGSFYQYALTKTGGNSDAVDWTLEPGHPAWLTMTSSGILQGAAPVVCGALGNPFFIRAKQGEESAIRKVSIKGVSGSGTVCP